MDTKYRPEIDGLRNIAVLSVIVYHAEFLVNGHNVLPGGFFGVDVFFVISGFLITSLMMGEFHKTGTISISRFYERRARRILPALLVVVLVSMPFAWMYLLPGQLIDYAKSIISSLSFGSNFYWNYSLQEYGAEPGLLKPFLHTWSLSVEEQYYIVFPLIMLAIYKWYKSHTIALLAAGLLLSLSFAEWMTSEDPSFSFYMLPSRFWELLVGALLANILHLHPQKNNDVLLNKTMPTFGLFLILYSFVFIEFDSGHPGFVTLIPVVGSMLIIWFASKQELVTKTLSSKYFVYIGLISYSLYLWHYPIFAFFRIDGLFYSNIGRIIAITLTFLLSMASVRYIENPLRDKRLLPSNKFFLLIGLLASLIVAMSVFAIKKDGFENRFESVAGFLNYEIDNSKLKAASWTINSQVNKRPFDPEKVKILILGNSHSKSLFNAFYQNPDLYGNYDFRRGVVGGIRNAQIACFDKSNSDNLRVANNFFLSDHYVQSQVIIVATLYRKGKCFTRQSASVLKSRDLDGLSHLVERSLHDGKRVVIFGNSLIFKQIDKMTIADALIGDQKKIGRLGLIAKRKSMFSELELEINHKYYELKAHKGKINKEVKEIATQFNVPYLDMYRFVCEEKDLVCFGLTPDGYKSFYDKHHFTLEGAKYFGVRMAQKGVLELLENQPVEK